MQYKKFSIKEYRAIDSAEIQVGNRLIPLIGVNESGKTSILKAILCFDRKSDKQNGREHLEYQNNYKTTDHDCSITAEVIIDNDDDLKAISSDLSLKEGDSLLAELTDAMTHRRSIALTRDIETKRYSVSNIEASPGKHNQLAKAIYDRLPFILYFDDFTDRVPDKLEFSKIVGGASHKITNKKLLGWQDIVSEIFNRATESEHDIESFLEIKDEDRQSGVLSDINDVLDKKVMEDWRQLKKRGIALADDSAELQLELVFKKTDAEKFHFQFKVADRARKKRRFFNVSERSKGFQWYFNFLMKLNFNPKYLGHQSNAIYLLDEPGSYLHESAQTELLQELREISKTNTILYCTHSQHLLDSDVINVGQTRIAEKVDGKVRVIPFGSYPQRKNQGALSPLFQALRLKSSVLDNGTKRALITEGIIDFYFFKMLFMYRNDWCFDEVTVIPGAGATQLKDLISWAIAYAENYMVLLDSDAEGRNAHDNYERFFGSGESNNFKLYATPSSPDEVRLESFLSKDDQETIKQLTESKSVKSAIISLYYFEDADARVAYLNTLSDTTLENLSLTKGLLNSHFGN